MAENNQTTYEFSITVIGTGENVDDAFQNALDELSADPYSVITNEVIYVVGGKVDEEEPEEVYEVSEEKEAVQQSVIDVLSLTPTEVKNTDERSLQEMAVSFITSKKEELKEENEIFKTINTKIKVKKNI